MREIKFRGYNRKNNVWLYGFYLQNRGAHFVCPDEFATGKSWDDYEIDPDTLGQYTGLKDRNGREIYEGDVVDLRPYYSQLHRIEYSCGQWICVDAGGGWIALIEDEQLGDEMNGVEVIGNIYDNPELMKGDQSRRT